jgi:hypothetical protein
MNNTHGAHSLMNDVRQQPLHPRLSRTKRLHDESHAATPQENQEAVCLTSFLAKSYPGSTSSIESRRREAWWAVRCAVPVSGARRCDWMALHTNMFSSAVLNKAG